MVTLKATKQAEQSELLLKLYKDTSYTAGWNVGVQQQQSPPAPQRPPMPNVNRLVQMLKAACLECFVNDGILDCPVGFQDCSWLLGVCLGSGAEGCHVLAQVSTRGDEVTVALCVREGVARAPRASPSDPGPGGLRGRSVLGLADLISHLERRNGNRQ